MKFALRYLSCKLNNLKEECKPNSQSAMHIVFFINVYTVKFK